MKLLHALAIVAFQLMLCPVDMGIAGELPIKLPDDPQSPPFHLPPAFPEPWYIVSDGQSHPEPLAAPPQPTAPPPPPFASPEGNWELLPPPARYGHAAIYDPVRDRLIVVGGSNPYEGGTNEVWTLSFVDSAGWSKLSPLGNPPPGRSFHYMIYDPVRDRVVLFGGVAEYASAPVLNDVWTLSLSDTPTWTQLSPSGTSPSARGMGGAIFDPVRDRMLIFGGTDASRNNLAEVWALSLGENLSWSRLTPEGTAPTPRYFPSVTYDASRDRMLVFAGWGGYYATELTDVWSLSLAGNGSWSPVNATGSGPPPHWEQKSVYDPVRDKLVVVVTYHDPYRTQNRSMDVWELSLSGLPMWERRDLPYPPARRFGTAGIYDPVRDRVVLSWGWDWNANGFGGDAFNEVWGLSLGPPQLWTDLSPSGRLPFQRLAHTATYDPVRDQMVIIGGWSTESYPTTYRALAANDAWALSLLGRPRWRKLTPSTLPTTRAEHSAVYDAAGDRIIVFGGFTGEFRERALNDVWALSLANEEWTQINPTGTPPPPRGSHCAVYDPRVNRMIVYGGRNEDYRSRFDDVWELSLSGTPAWRRFEPSGDRPPARAGHSAIYDPSRSRMIVFGGRSSTSGYAGTNDVFALSLSNGPPAWEFLAASAPQGLPAGRLYHGAAYDPIRRRMLVLLGVTSEDYSSINDVWALTLRPKLQWIPLSPSGQGPQYRRWFGLIYDPIRDRAVFTQGNLNLPLYFDTWFLNFADQSWISTAERIEVSVSKEPSEIGQVSLGPAQPNPSSSSVTFSFTMAQQGPVSIRVYDVAGRLVRTLINEPAEPGPHDLVWNATDDHGSRVGAGVYFYRMVAGSWVSQRKVVFLER